MGSSLILRSLIIICAVQKSLLQKKVVYTNEELTNLDIEPIDKKSGLIWGYFYRQIKDLNKPYREGEMEKMQGLGNDAQEFVDQLKQITSSPSEPDYYTLAKRNQDFFQRIVDAVTVNVERIMMAPGSHQMQMFRQCLAITNTMLNSRLDIQRYYKIRYMYTWTLHYEVGYVSHEILRHYTIVIDLFHLVATRYENQPYDDHTPPRYMLYMYSAILYECKMIIKLCHMLHELENKYNNFDDYTKLWRETPGSDEQFLNAQKKQKEASARALAAYNAELQRVRAERMRALKKKHKKALKAFKGSLTGDTKTQGGKKMSGSGFGATGKQGKKAVWKPADYFYGSVNASDQKKSKFPHIYGWSIENFPQ